MQKGGVQKGVKTHIHAHALTHTQTWRHICVHQINLGLILGVGQHCIYNLCVYVCVCLPVWCVYVNVCDVCMCVCDVCVCVCV
jgi:hypothetical protein